MANRLFQQYMYSPVHYPVCLFGQIEIAADASVSSDSIPYASAARTAAGTYTITLNDTYYSYLGCNATLEAATAVDLVPQVVSNDVTSAKTIVIKLLEAGVATDPSAVCKINVVLFLKNSGAQDGA